MLSSRQMTLFITITALALVQCLNAYLKPGYYNIKQLLSTVKFQEENCSTVETKSCRPISEQVCNKGRRAELHLGVFWDWHYNSMFFENWITCWCFLGMDSHLNVFWDWTYIWVFPEIGTTFGCFLRTELHLDVFL